MAQITFGFYKSGFCISREVKEEPNWEAEIARAQRMEDKGWSVFCWSEGLLRKTPIRQAQEALQKNQRIQAEQNELLSLLAKY